MSHRPPNVILLTDPLRNVPLTGIGRYVLELARGMHMHPGIGRLRCFAGRDWVDAPWTAFAPSQTDCSSAQSGGIARLRRVLPGRCLQDRCSFALKKWAFQQKSGALSGHVLHGPNYLLLPYDGPSLTTIHDLSFIHYPDYHPRERIKLLERELPKTLAQSTGILTDTEFVRREIVAYLGVPSERVNVTHLGVDACFHPRSREETAAVLDGLQLTHDGYLLSVATFEPRKNLSRLVRAYARLPDALTARRPLVLAGGSGWLTQSMESLIQPLERKGTIRRLGYVPETHLPGLVAGAAGVALPSLYEGFGLPVLEAMASAVPVLTSNCSSLPEVAGDAALLVNPEDEDAICLGLERLLTDDVFRAQARQRGPIQAGRFTWAKCVDETIATYHKVLQRVDDPGETGT
jgi:glycosyltransferase involved in cell wall biosynthesis